MTANVCQIVDSIASSPTVLLDLNAGADTQYGFAVAKFDAPPPPLRRTVSSNMLSDGDRISATSYQNRTINLTLDLIQSSQDTWATTWQTLARNIDQDFFWLKYQPTGATAPVFFRCYRAEVPSIEDVSGATAYRMPTLQIPADPFAYGLPEDIAAFTITNNPSSGTNRQFYTLPTIKGDVETPIMLAQTTGVGVTSNGAPIGAPMYVASYSVSGSTHTWLARDLTELTAGTDTAAPTTGAGTNYIDGNYRNCTFNTDDTLTARLTGSFTTTLNPMPGTYRVLMRVVSLAGVSGTNRTTQFAIGVQANGAAYTYQPSVSVAVNYSAGNDLATLVDLGTVQFPVGTDVGAVGLAPASTTGRAPNIAIQAGHADTSAADLRFDEIYFIPITTTYGYGNLTIVKPSIWNAASLHNVVAYDGVTNDMRTLYDSTGTTPFSGVPVPAYTMSWIGALPVARPGYNNYLQFVVNDTLVTTGTWVFTGRYYPRYLYVRPSAT